MKKNNYNITFFFIAWGIAAILMLKQNLNNDIVKVLFFSLFTGLVASVLFAFLRKPLRLLYRRNFDKHYKYNTPRTRKK